MLSSLDGQRRLRAVPLGSPAVLQLRLVSILRLMRRNLGRHLCGRMPSALDGQRRLRAVSVLQLRLVNVLRLMRRKLLRSIRLGHAVVGDERAGGPIVPADSNSILQA